MAMAMKSGGESGGRRGRRRRGGAVMNEINMTPFIDVVLVLLIIFMVAAPMMTQGVQVALPKANAKPIEQSKPVEVTIKRDGRLFVGSAEVPKEGLVAAIPAVLAYNKISTDLSRFAARLEGFGSEFSAILSRQSEAANMPAAIGTGD